MGNTSTKKSTNPEIQEDVTNNSDTDDVIENSGELHNAGDQEDCISNEYNGNIDLNAEENAPENRTPVDNQEEQTTSEVESQNTIVDEKNEDSDLQKEEKPEKWYNKVFGFIKKSAYSAFDTISWIHKSPITKALIIALAILAILSLTTGPLMIASIVSVSMLGLGYTMQEVIGAYKNNKARVIRRIDKSLGEELADDEKKLENDRIIRSITEKSLSFTEIDINAYRDKHGIKSITLDPNFEKNIQKIIDKVKSDKAYYTKWERIADNLVTVSAIVTLPFPVMKSVTFQTVTKATMAGIASCYSINSTERAIADYNKLLSNSYNYLLYKIGEKEFLHEKETSQEGKKITEKELKSIIDNLANPDNNGKLQTRIQEMETEYLIRKFNKELAREYNKYKEKGKEKEFTANIDKFKEKAIENYINKKRSSIRRCFRHIRRYFKDTWYGGPKFSAKKVESFVDELKASKEREASKDPGRVLE